MSTDETPGILINGIPHSAEWREKQRAAERAGKSPEPRASTAVPVADFATAEKDFVSSVMIPVDKLSGGTGSGPAGTKASDSYIEGLLGGSRDQLRAQEPDEDGTPSSTQGGELDRWFEEQATAVPQAPAAQTLPPGSASLEIEIDPGVRAERARRERLLRVRVSRAGAARPESRGPAGRRAGSGWMRVTRTRAAAVAALIVVGFVWIAIAITGGSPAHLPRVNAASASASTTFAGVLDASLSRAGRIPSIERITVAAGRPRRRSHRTHRPPHPHAITQPAASTAPASSSSYTARFASQTGSSPAPTESSPASTSTGGSSSSAQGSSPQSRTGPSGPISLIGAGTTPSG